jgi:hypothetical protein
MRRLVKRLVYLIPLRHRLAAARKITQDLVVCCEDCEGRIYDDYMVVDRLWRAYGVGRGHLCLDCFQRRLGRPLLPVDFTTARINDMLHRGVRMAEEIYG